MYICLNPLKVGSVCSMTMSNKFSRGSNNGNESQSPESRVSMFNLEIVKINEVCVNTDMSQSPESRVSMFNIS